MKNMNRRSRSEESYPQRVRRLLLTLFIVIAVTVLGASPTKVFAEIQLDGNAVKSTGQPAGSTDWDEINCLNPDIACAGIPSLNPGGGSIAKTGLVVDRPEPTFAQFTTGGSKDEQDITSWKHRSGTPPSKDDLSHAFAAAFNKNVGGINHTILAFGMDRYDTSGDAQLGFWFLGQNVQPVAGGDFSGEHQDNDLLILVNFSNGGTVPTIQVFKWLNGAPVSQGIGQAVLCANGEIPAGQSFCGITNPTSIAAPWPYENKDTGVSATFPPGAFFEGAIDLTAAGLDSCFTGFIAESRSSTSITATLKDFADPAGGFNLCSINVDKSCGNGALVNNQTQLRFTITGKVQNTGAATLYDVSLSDNPAADNNQKFDVVDCATKTNDLGDFPVSSLASGAEVCYKATITVALTTQAVPDTVSVTSNSESDGSGTAVTDTAQASCSPPPVPASLSVTKTCTTSVEDAGANLVVKVTAGGQVCNTNISNLHDVTLSDNIAGSITLSKTTLAADTDPNTQGNQGECISYTLSYFPSSGNSSIPGNLCFADTVTANAKNIFNAAVTPMTATANCSLCPTGVCPPPAP
jgi:hypothetical protein